MRTFTITWDMPTTRESGLPLLGTDILHTEVSLSADQGASFGLLSNVVLPTREIVIPDLEVGTWIVRFVVVDTLNRRSQNADFELIVVDETPPGIVQNVSVTSV